MIPGGTRIGVIAGSGQLPLHIAQYLSDQGRDLYVAGFSGTADPGLENPAWETGWYEVHSLGSLLEGLGRAQVRQVVLAGRVSHSEIYSTGQFDDMLRAFMRGLKDTRPATVLGGLVEMINRSGFDVLPLTEAAPDLLPAAGHRAGPPPSEDQIPDILLGWRMARLIADNDIGQTVIVKGGAVVAVEAMEGTDEAITRAGTITSGGLTVVKLAAAAHDFRYDVPTLGPETILKIGEAGGGLIAVEAGRCFILDPEKVHALCTETGVTVLAGVETGKGRVHWPEG